MEKSNSLIKTLVNLKGNARACVWTEPLFSIPWQLYTPYVALYQVALGLTKGQIGIIASVSMLVQVFAALVSGIITDKLGRKHATHIFDVISWSIPCLIWAFSRNFTHFLLAAIINGFWRVPANSWNCLLVEDTEEKQLVQVFAWINIAGLLAAFVAPVAGVFIARYGLVPTVRVLYLLAFVMMTAKFQILDWMAKETERGKIRMQETAGVSPWAMLGEYRGVWRQVIHTPQTMVALGVMVVLNICTMINTNFWSLLLTQRLHVPKQYIASFPLVKALVMLLFYFVVIPRLNPLRFRRPMLTGFSLFAVSQIVLISAPVLGYGYILVSIALEACSLALLQPFTDALVAVSVDPEERARIVSILHVCMLLLSTPFGWLAGHAAELDHRLPFALNTVLLILGFLLMLHVGSRAEQGKGAHAVQ
ncbi:MAG TPA: MFS transporter [Firmicutes bacterium]|nr:MFS transporter [Bacillota bacterium]